MLVCFFAHKAMLRTFLLILATALWSPVSSAAAAVEAEDGLIRLIIDDVDIRGLHRTKRHVVEREFEFTIGEPTTLAAVDETLRRLRNTMIFLTVASRLEPLAMRPGDALPRYRLRIQIEERWTLLGIAQFRHGGDVTQIIFGLYDINAFGRGFELGGRVEQLADAYSGELWLYEPRFLGGRQRFEAEVGRRNRVFTLYDLDEPQILGGFLRERTFLELRLIREIRPWFRLGPSFRLLRDDFNYGAIDPLVRGVQEDAGGLPAAADAVLPGLRVQFGRVNYDIFGEEGWRWVTTVEQSVPAIFGDDVFAIIRSQAVHFLPLWRHSQIASRLALGYSSTDAIQHHFFIGGLDQVRGFLDNRWHGPAYATGNVELRVPSLIHRWVVLQHVAFLDAAAVGDRLSDLGHVRGASTGVGLRILSPAVYRLMIRVDYAVPIHGTGATNWSLAASQFFE
jgi:outer membrane protein assembly factor BamA